MTETEHEPATGIGADVSAGTDVSAENAVEAVIGAIDTANVYIEGHGRHGTEHPSFYLDATFWVGVAFVLVAVGLFRPLKNAAKALILKNIEAIKNRFDEAEQLQKDAQKLYKEYEARAQNAGAETKAILAQSKQELDALKKERLAALDKAIEVKQKEAESRIDAARKRAVDEIAARAAAQTLASVRKIVEAGLDAKLQDKLIARSIELVGKL